MTRIVKRNGSIEPLSEEKINRVLMRGVENIRNVSAAAVSSGAAASIFDGMTTRQLHETLVKAAAALITPSTPNYSRVAARLIISRIRKDAFGQYDYPVFYRQIMNGIDKGAYDAGLLKSYEIEEIEELGIYIKPKRDELFDYAATVRLLGEYLVRDGVTALPIEGPQHVFMLTGMCLFQSWENGNAGKTRMEMVKAFYDLTSTFRLSLPASIMTIRDLGRVPGFPEIEVDAMAWMKCWLLSELSVR